MFPSFSEKLIYPEYPSPQSPSPLMTIVETIAKNIICSFIQPCPSGGIDWTKADFARKSKNIALKPGQQLGDTKLRTSNPGALILLSKRLHIAHN